MVILELLGNSTLKPGKLKLSLRSQKAQMVQQQTCSFLPFWGRYLGEVKKYLLPILGREAQNDTK